MGSLASPAFVTLPLVGLVVGLVMLWRGFAGYRTATRIADTATSSVASMAAGEVRLHGRIEAAEVSLISPLQSAPCVYYHATIEVDDEGGGRGLDEERGIGFVLHDGTGSIRVFPRGARWDAPLVYDEHTDAFGGTPSGLDPRTGSAIGPAELDREAAVARLLSPQPSTPAAATGHGRLTYRERRLGPGDEITVIGRALPFWALSDPGEADVEAGSIVAADDPEVLASLAAARASGRLVADPALAWGNAAIPGFGIGRPVRVPDLHAEAAKPDLAGPADAERFERRFHIEPEALVLASTPDVRLLIAHGVPGAAVERHHDRFIIGLLGAVLAIASALVLASGTSGVFGT